MATHLPEGEGGHVTPEPSLGANFASAPKRALEFSARAVVAGERPAISWEPIQPDDADISLQDLRTAVLHRDGACVYCATRSATLQLDTVNDNHFDLSADNHVAADPICHGYHHLDALGESDARLAYLPGLDSTDVNLLQRVAIAELFHGDEAQRADARDVVNWLASHHQYAKDTLGSSSPNVLGAVLNRVDPNVRAKRAVVLTDLALIFNPTHMREHAAVWHGELLSARAREEWARLFQDLTRLKA